MHQCFWNSVWYYIWWIWFMTDISLLLPKPGFVPLQFLLGPKRLKTCNDQLKMNFTRLKILRTPSISPPGWTLAVRFLRGQSLLVNLIYTLYIYMLYFVVNKIYLPCTMDCCSAMADGSLISNLYTSDIFHSRWDCWSAILKFNERGLSVAITTRLLINSFLRSGQQRTLRQSAWATTKSSLAEVQRSGNCDAGWIAAQQSMVDRLLISNLCNARNGRIFIFP